MKESEARPIEQEFRNVLQKHIKHGKEIHWKFEDVGQPKLKFINMVFSIKVTKE